MSSRVVQAASALSALMSVLAVVGAVAQWWRLVVVALAVLLSAAVVLSAYTYDRVRVTRTDMIAKYRALAAALDDRARTAQEDLAEHARLAGEQHERVADGIAGTRSAVQGVQSAQADLGEAVSDLAVALRDVRRDQTAAAAAIAELRTAWIEERAADPAVTGGVIQREYLGRLDRLQADVVRLLQVVDDAGPNNRAQPEQREDT